MLFVTFPSTTLPQLLCKQLKFVFVYFPPDKKILLLLGSVSLLDVYMSACSIYADAIAASDSGAGECWRYELTSLKFN